MRCWIFFVGFHDHILELGEYSEVAPGEEFDFFGVGKEVDVADKAFFLTDGLADDFTNGMVVGLRALVGKNFV